MSNEFYNHTTYPANGSSLSSAALRAELDAIEAGLDKMPALAGQGGKVVRVKGDGTGLEAVASDAITSSDVHAAASKTTPVDADEIPLIDSAASWGLKKLTWANLKATAKGYFDTLYALTGHNHDGTYSPTAHTHSGVYEPANANLLETADIGSTVQAYDADTAKLDLAQSWTATQKPDSGTASVSTTSTYTFDGADQIREVTMTNAITVTFGAPTGITEHAMYIFKLKAGDTAARTYAWNAAYKFPGAALQLASGTTTNGAKDIISFIGGPSNTLEYMGVQKDVR